jgi:protein-arginine kinase activator protein McsA
MTSAPTISELKAIIEAGPGSGHWSPVIQRHYEVELAAAICDEIKRLTRKRNDENILGWSDWDSDDELRRQISELREELADLTEIETATERKAA